MITASNWTDYEILDTSCGEKLERWGSYLLIRPAKRIRDGDGVMLTITGPAGAAENGNSLICRSNGRSATRAADWI